MKLKLYHYWRSSSSWRVRWAFALKGIQCEMVRVNLLNGESESEAHLRRNPLSYVPVLEIAHDDGSLFHLFESMAILEWSEEVRPQPSLFYGDAERRATIRQLAEMIDSDTAPLQNLNPQYLHSDDPEKRKAWAQHWIRNGLSAYEKIVSCTAGHFSVGNQLTMADLCLIPQCYNALRYEVPLDQFPTVHRIYKNATETEGYKLSEPENYKPSGM